MKDLKLYIESVVTEELAIQLKESSGKEPSKEQIDATFDLLKTAIERTKFSGKVFVAGGAVRDMVMGLDPKDIDLVVELEEGGIKFAEFLARKLGIYKAGSNPVVFPKFGTAKVHFDGFVYKGIPLDGVDVECVHTRNEEYTDGSRKPTTKYGTIKQDVFRRDLTINSLLMDIMSGKIVDLTGMGHDDISKGVIRTPSEPDRIFTEDPLRLMRAVRFAGRYDYSVPDFMADSIRKNADQLKIISRERIREELEKILSGANPDVGIRFLYDLNLMPYILPQIAQNKEQSVEAAKQGDGFMGKLLLMLKNVPAKSAVKAARNLKMSNDEVDVLGSVIGAMQSIAKDGSSANILKVGSDMFQEGHGDHFGYIRPIDKQVQQLEPFFSKGPVQHVTPNELMQKFDLKPGPILGKLQALQKNLWYNNPRITRDEVMRKIEQEL